MWWHWGGITEVLANIATANQTGKDKRGKGMKYVYVIEVRVQIEFELHEKV